MWPVILGESLRLTGAGILLGAAGALPEDILHRYRQMQDEVTRIIALLEPAGER